MATIKHIEARTIHQIQSGQVIVDLCSVVKELVENSIDAGATNIEVRFKNQGLDAIEVQDNGSGISKENYDTLALKHYTSKLSTYSDLESLETFGFRGEALSSLCALSKFTVTTCLASDAPKGSKLEYETSGKLSSTSVVAAQKGTTVSVENLFHNLPVRRRELERNIKREWNKVLGVLNQYACIQTGLKFSVSQQPNKGKRMVLFSTKGNQTTRDNIVNVFGAKTLTVLIPLDLELELDPTNTSGPQLKTQGDREAKVIRIRGHVSRPAYGEGRQTPDRQMFFVNGRPCGLPQFAKVFNEVYRSYNSSQSPFIFADIQLDTHLYDVNVSPDKRTILLHDQTRMLDNLREALSSLFESQDYALPTSQLQAPKQSLLRKPSPARQDTPSTEASSKRLGSVDVNRNFNPTSADPQLIGEGDNVDIASDDEAERNSTRNSSVSTNAVVQTSHDSSLISRWVERKCGSREDTETKRHRVVKSVGGSNDGLELDSRRPRSPPFNEAQSFPGGESTEVSNRLADFQARLKKVRDEKGVETADKPTLSTSEPPVPALAAPARMTDNMFNKAYSSSVNRNVPETATITIGDHTVTSVIGSPYKKQRRDSQCTGHSSARKVSREPVPVPVPSFNGRLTQMFAAHAERSRADKGQIKITTERQDDSQHSDSSSEKLFVDDDFEDESDHECAIDVTSRCEVQEHISSQDSQSAKSTAREDLDAAQTSPADQTDAEYKDDEFDAACNENDADESNDNADVREEAISEESQKRTQSFVKGGFKKKDSTCHLQQTLRVNGNYIRSALALQQGQTHRAFSSSEATFETARLDAEDAEAKLSLTISKSDFERMKIIGQFNLGFILASRAAAGDSMDTLNRSDKDDELFIIDQHATDEKYNFERLQASTVVQSQRLVHPKTLELTAVEEDIVQENIEALEANGFIVGFDDSGDKPVGTRCQLLSLPLSRETTFSLDDLEELISLLRDHPSGSTNTIPRPSKVRKMFAMRACRSSVMIGKSLTNKQMEKLVRHMGELDKPWNCPHGRPTMRHLCGLGAWDDLGWREGYDFDGIRAQPTDWAAYLHGG